MGRFKGLTIATVAWAFDPVVMRGRLRRLGRGWESKVMKITVCSRVHKPHKQITFTIIICKYLDKGKHEDGNHLALNELNSRQA